MLLGERQAAFGWAVHVGPDANPRSLRNFPLQANGAEILRIACCLATEAGITICAPVHDALLIEADAGEIENAVAECQRIMRQAAEIVLNGFALRTEAKIIRHPERYTDPRGAVMWERVNRLLADTPTPCTAATLPLAPVRPPSILISSLHVSAPDGSNNRPGTAAPAPAMRGPMPSKTKPPRHAPGEKFLRGPIPWPWMQRAARLPGRALHVALILWQESGMRNRRTIRFCLRWAVDLGMSIDTARRGLRRLEVAGLVTLKRMPGHGLEVTINDTN